MIKKLRQWRERWTDAGASLQLDAILGHVPGKKATARQRKEWLNEVLLWIFETRPLGTKGPVDANARLRYLFKILERNPEWRAKVCETVNALMLETSFVGLLVGTGIATEFTFGSELWSRLTRKIFLQAPADYDLADLFASVFSGADDFIVVEKLNPVAVEQLIRLLGSDERAVESVLRRLREHGEKALRILAIQYVSSAFSARLAQLRKREFQQDEPFFDLLSSLDRFLERPTSDTASAFEHHLAAADSQLQWVADRFDQFGITMDVVYQFEVQQNRSSRIRYIIQLMVPGQASSEQVVRFLATIVKDSAASFSVSSLARRASRLMARRIVETNADVGDHYIARKPNEYSDLFKRACGGGLITVITSVLKVVMGTHTLFVSGFLASLNYASSFLVIHFCGFTLGTKQPAMTGAAIADRMGEKTSAANQASLQSEMQHVLRSQFYSVGGNVLAVIPGVLFVDLLTFLIRGKHFLRADKAEYVLKSASIFGPTLLYAAFTGILLYMSSVAAGWANNWFLMREQYEAIQHNRRLRNLIGIRRAERLAQFFRNNISGIVGNVVLGFSLGLVPALAAFFSLPIDVRHVTLMSGQVGLALPAMGWAVFTTWAPYLAILGIVTIGFLNIAVSFVLAVIVALRSKGLSSSARLRVYREIPFLRVLGPYVGRMMPRRRGQAREKNRTSK